MASCVNCGAPMRMDGDRGTLVCDHCGSRREVPAIIERLEQVGESPNGCPLCLTALSAARYEGNVLLYCPRCFGMLIDMRRFEAVVDAARANEGRRARTVVPRQQEPGERVLGCPLCRQPMVSHIYGGPGNVVIDTCERCLVNWLDAGELRRMAIAPDY